MASWRRKQPENITRCQVPRSRLAGEESNQKTELSAKCHIWLAGEDSNQGTYSPLPANFGPWGLWLTRCVTQPLVWRVRTEVGDTLSSPAPIFGAGWGGGGGVLRSCTPPIRLDWVFLLVDEGSCSFTFLLGIPAPCLVRGFAILYFYVNHRVNKTYTI